MVCRLPQGRAVCVHALALPQADAAQARRKNRQSYQKKGRKPSALTMDLCGFVLVFTTLSPARDSAKQVLDWYRRCWQIDLLFKRQKSLLGLAQLYSKRRSTLSRVKLWMKVVYAWLVEQQVRLFTLSPVQQSSS